MGLTCVKKIHKRTVPLSKSQKNGPYYHLLSAMDEVFIRSYELEDDGFMVKVP